MTQIGKTYGEALYILAREEGLSKSILQQLKALEDAFGQEPQFLRLLSSPTLSKQERCQILDDSFRGRVHPYLLNFMKILTERGYIQSFSGCCRVYREEYNRDNGILPVTAVTALPLDEAQHRRLRDKLCEITGKTIELESRVDSQCLGGVRLDFDGKQVDGTLRNRLDDIRRILKNTVL